MTCGWVLFDFVFFFFFVFKDGKHQFSVSVSVLPALELHKYYIAIFEAKENVKLMDGS